MKSKPQTVDDILMKFGDQAVSSLLGEIEDTRLAFAEAKQALQELILSWLPEERDGKYIKHFCPFNDGEQNCDCYTNAIQEMKQNIVKNMQLNQASGKVDNE